MVKTPKIARKSPKMLTTCAIQRRRTGTSFKTSLKPSGGVSLGRTGVAIEGLNSHDIRCAVRYRLNGIRAGWSEGTRFFARPRRAVLHHAAGAIWSGSVQSGGGWRRRYWPRLGSAVHWRSSLVLCGRQHWETRCLYRSEAPRGYRVVPAIGRARRCSARELPPWNHGTARVGIPGSAPAQSAAGVLLDLGLWARRTVARRAGDGSHPASLLRADQR